MVFKKDLTPIGKKGTVIKHKGKGSVTPPPNPMGRMTNKYPKPAPAPMGPEAPAPMGPEAPAPMGPPGQMPLPLE